MRYTIALVLFLSACSAAPPVKPLGEGSYSTTADSRVTATAAYSEAMKQAADYCAGTGKTSNTRSQSNMGSDNYYRTSVVFTCD
jgi:hypothetical protein